jgi:hypothetical protein
VVDPQHLVAGELENAGHALADDRAAHVPDVHLLGQVGAGHVHHDAVRSVSRRDAQPVILCRIIEGRNLRQVRGQERGLKAQIDKTRTGDLGRHADIVKRQRRDDPLGQVARFVAELLGERQGAVELVIAKLGIVGRLEPGALNNNCVAESRLNSRRDLLEQKIGNTAVHDRILLRTLVKLLELGIDRIDVVSIPCRCAFAGRRCSINAESLKHIVPILTGHRSQIQLDSI